MAGLQRCIFDMLQKGVLLQKTENVVAGGFNILLYRIRPCEVRFLWYIPECIFKVLLFIHEGHII